jgi:hypothetical protein
LLYVGAGIATPRPHHQQIAGAMLGHQAEIIGERFQAAKIARRETNMMKAS